MAQQAAERGDRDSDDGKPGKSSRGDDEWEDES